MAAVEAARRFFLCLFGSKAEALFSKGLFAGIDGFPLHGHLFVLCDAVDVGVLHNLRCSVAAHGVAGLDTVFLVQGIDAALRSRKVLVGGKSSPAAISHSARNGGGASRDVARGKDTSLRCPLVSIHADPAPRGEIDSASVFAEVIEIRLHAHGEDNGIAVESVLTARTGFELEAAFLVKAALGNFVEIGSSDSAVHCAHGGHGTGVVDDDVFLCGKLEIFGGSAHGTRLLEADYMNFLRTQAAGCESAVEGHSATTHDNDLLADAPRVDAEGGFTQKFNGMHSAIGTGDGQAVLSGNAGRKDDRIVTGCDLVHGDIDANLRVHDGADACLEHKAHFAVNHVPGQAEVGHAVARHAAQHGLGLVDGYAVAQERQVVSGREASWAATNDGGLLAGRRTVFKDDPAVLSKGLGCALEGTDIQAAVLLGSVALVHAEVRTGAAGDAGEGILGAQVAQRLSELPLLDESVHFLDGITCGTGGFARGGAELFFQFGTHHDRTGNFSAKSGWHGDELLELIG